MKIKTENNTYLILLSNRVKWRQLYQDYIGVYYLTKGSDKNYLSVERFDKLRLEM